MLAMNGVPARLYGFQSGSSPRRTDSHAKWRQGTNWYATSKASGFAGRVKPGGARSAKNGVAKRTSAPLRTASPTSDVHRSARSGTMRRSPARRRSRRAVVTSLRRLHRHQEPPRLRRDRLRYVLRAGDEAQIPLPQRRQLPERDREPRLRVGRQAEAHLVVPHPLAPLRDHAEQLLVDALVARDGNHLVLAYARVQDHEAAQQLVGVADQDHARVAVAAQRELDLRGHRHAEDLRVEVLGRRRLALLGLLEQLGGHHDAVLARLDLADELGGLGLAELGRLLRHGARPSRPAPAW